MIDTPKTLRSKADKLMDEAEDLRSEARDLEREAEDLEEQADKLEENYEDKLKPTCLRLLAGYLSGAAMDIVLKVLDEGEELPGFREVCANYGEARPL